MTADPGRTGPAAVVEGPDVVAQAVLRLLDDHDLRREMSTSGRGAVVARFGIVSCGDVHPDAYAAALGQAKMRRSRR